MSDLDELRKRLDKLRDFNRQQNKQNVTDDQLQGKLRKLKGLDPSDAMKPEKNANYFVPPKFKSDVEATDDLLKQLSDEVAVDNKFRSRYDAFDQSPVPENDQLVSNLSNLSTDEKFDASFSNNFVSKSYDRTAGEHGKVMSQEELEKELGVIKNKMREFNYEYKDLSKNKNPTGQSNSKKNSNLNKFSANDPFSNVQSDSSDDEASYINLVRKFVDEVKLENDATSSRTEENDQRRGGSSKENKRPSDGRSNESKKEDDQPNDDPEEEKLDFCYICSEDAALICLDCDRERFCLQCFKEFHEDPDYRSHRYARFNARK